MLGLLFGPVGIAATIIGTVGVAAYKAMQDDKDRSDYKHNNCTKAIDNHNEERKSSIKQGIEEYKKNSKSQIKNNYDVDIEFGNTVLNGSKVIINDDKIDKFSSISKIENEINELDELIKELKELKIESNI